MKQAYISPVIRTITLAPVRLMMGSDTSGINFNDDPINGGPDIGTIFGE